MFYFNTVFLFIYLQFFIYAYTLEDANDQKILTDEERNLRCCTKHMGCCKKTEEPTNFEVRALLIKCDKPGRCDGEKSSKSCSQGNPKQYNKNLGEQCGTEPNSDPVEVVNCEKKIKLTIKLKNTGHTNCKNQYIIIDHVFDPISEKKQKLLNPYVLKIKQQPVLQTYGLICENAVNSQASEKVISKKDSGYTGCNTDPSQNPTCGSVKYNNEVIPYSTGFCCSCNKDENEKNIDELNFTSSLKSPSKNEVEGPKKARNIYTNNNIPEVNKNNFEHYEFSGKAGKVKENAVVVNVPNIIADNVDNSGPIQSVNDERLMPFSGTKQPSYIQKRGGQDCSDKYTPPDVNPESYHDSSHCLEFSDIWYSVYRLEQPKLSHSLQIQIYEKYQDREGNFKWRDLTKNAIIFVGTNNQHYTNDDNTISVNYISKMTTPTSACLNYKIHKLLIPDCSNIDVSSYPELQGGPPEYLVVTENEVQANGKTCNVAGVGYEAFAKQPKRCAVPKDSCLQNQPKQLWEHDHEMEANGNKGSYFLKYFGELPENPIITDERTQNKTLTMIYTECYTAVLDIEIRADTNIILRPNSLAILTEVYIDSSGQKRTSIIAKVFNSGLVSSVFLVSLSDCPLDMPASFNNIISKPVLIAPQHQHIFHLEVECPLPKSNLLCAAEVHNVKGDLIAVRKIRLQKLDRCICIWYCLCACLLADGGLKCKPMSLEHYHAAGFQGGLPVALHVVHYTFLDDMISLMLYILLFLCLTLIIMGLAKALIGCCVVCVGLWGLDLILDLPKQMNSYYEPSIRHRKVIYDESGWPIHPDSKQRVRNISLPAEFCINVVFFYIYPFAVLWTITKKLCFSSYSKPTDSELDICKCKSGSVHSKTSSAAAKASTKKDVSKVSSKDKSEKSDHSSLL